MQQRVIMCLVSLLLVLQVGSLSADTRPMASDAMRGCPGDVDGDGLVNVGDLLSIIAAWGPCASCPEDVNDDGQVDVNDLLAVIAGWGDCGLDVTTGCIQFAGGLAREGCGRPAQSSNPNGSFIASMERTFVFGSNDTEACVGEPREDDYVLETYPVQGTTLQDLSNQIFDLENGSGNLEDGRRYAGSVVCSVRDSGSFSWEENKLTYRIDDLWFVLTVRIPSWDPPDDASEADKEEWERFISRVLEHEMGHVQRYKHHFPQLVKKFVDQPEGQLSLPEVPTPPRFKNGKPADEESAQVLERLRTGVDSLIGKNFTYLEMLLWNMVYDAPPSEGNPGGTDHGRVQGAVLNF